MRGYNNKIIKINLDEVPNKMFNSMFQTPHGKDIFGFLQFDLTVIRMIDASNLGRAAVDPICNDLYKSFFYNKMTIRQFNKWKQFIGYMIKFIMAANGYFPAERNITIQSENGEEGVDGEGNRKCFSYGTRYKKIIKNNSLIPFDLNDKRQMKLLSKSLEEAGIDEAWINEFLGESELDETK